MSRVGVVLLNLGGPERIQDVGPFLYNLFADPEIIRLPSPALQKPLAWLISTLRSGKSQEAYRSIGGGSPLRRITEQQARELQSLLRQRGIDATSYVAMRYWHPFTESAVADIKADGMDEVVVLPLYPISRSAPVDPVSASCSACVRQIRPLRNCRFAASAAGLIIPAM